MEANQPIGSHLKKVGSHLYYSMIALTCVNFLVFWNIPERVGLERDKLSFYSYHAFNLIALAYYGRLASSEERSLQ